MSNLFLLYDMALEPEIRGEKNQGEIISTNKWARIVISLSIGFLAGLSLFFIINALSTPSLLPTSSPPTPSTLPASSEPVTESVDVAALCKAGVIKYTPLGAYPGGSDDVKAALNYCDNLS
jgi:hypothetical protein